MPPCSGRVTATRPDTLSSDPLNPCGRRRETTPARCPLASPHANTHTDTDTFQRNVKRLLIKNSRNLFSVSASGMLLTPHKMGMNSTYKKRNVFGKSCWKAFLAGPKVLGTPQASVEVMNTLGEFRGFFFFF